MEILQYDDFRTEKITALINARSTFEIVGVSGNMGSTVRILETTIESAGLKCRGIPKDALPQQEQHF
ncbi:hypothetical protein ACUIHB_01865 [Aeromonas veronii]|uniref:hypothetical protein n=1 Tax=Aeromonas veronii TaxID=654 RepID=UPI001F226E7A|nr:hypothetical protein [Aeromonas veronii]